MSDGVIFSPNASAERIASLYRASIAVDVRGRIRFGITKLLRLGEDLSKAALRFSISVRMKFDVPFRIP